MAQWHSADPLRQNRPDMWVCHVTCSARYRPARTAAAASCIMYAAGRTYLPARLLRGTPIQWRGNYIYIHFFARWGSFDNLLKYHTTYQILKNPLISATTFYEMDQIHVKKRIIDKTKIITKVHFRVPSTYWL